MQRNHPIFVCEFVIFDD